MLNLHADCVPCIEFLLVIWRRIFFVIDNLRVHGNGEDSQTSKGQWYSTNSKEQNQVHEMLSSKSSSELPACECKMQSMLKSNWKPKIECSK